MLRDSRTGGTGVPPPPASQRMSLLFSLTANAVIGFGTNSVIRPALARACFVSATVAFADVLRIMHFLPNAVIRGGDFGISDLVSIRSLRPSHRRHWFVLAWHARGRGLLTFFRRDQPHFWPQQATPRGHRRRRSNVSSSRCRRFSPLKFPAKESPQPARVRIDVVPNI